MCAAAKTRKLLYLLRCVHTMALILCRDFSRNSYDEKYVFLKNFELLFTLDDENLTL
jgi:hypothetical protein